MSLRTCANNRRGAPASAPDREARRALLPYVDAALTRALRARTRVVIPNTPLDAGLVPSCPYCRGVIELDAHMCRHCRAIATDDAGSEEPLVPKLRRGDPPRQQPLLALRQLDPLESAGMSRHTRTAVRAARG